MKAKFVNPYTDYGFKKIFGEEASKNLLIDFLNTLLPSYHQIADLTFKNTEQLGLTDFDRKAIYDIYCENDKGEKFIVELQRAKQAFFKERTIYKGKQIGQYDEKLNIAREAKAMGMSLANITKLTKLSEDDIQKL